MGVDKDSAIRAWNSLPRQSPPPELVERMAESLEFYIHEVNRASGDVGVGVYDQRDAEKALAEYRKWKEGE